VLFELAMIRMLRDSGNNPSVAKCVYVAPTKVSRGPLESLPSHTSCSQALCSEKFNEWTKKFSGLGIACKSFERIQSAIDNKWLRL